MRKLLGWLMEQHFHFPCFGTILKVYIVSIVLTSATSLACWGGGSGGNDYSYDDEGNNSYLNISMNSTYSAADLDEHLVLNLTGIKGTVDRNAKSAWLGWEPSNETQQEWKEWYENWLEENEKNGEGPWSKKKTGEGGGGPGGTGGNGSEGSGGQDFSAERGPGSGWPNLSGWADLGAGNGGTPVPPWAYSPRNIGKPTICYLPPIRGTCKGPDRHKQPEMRWGYNPYVDECQQYEYSGCGGTRNKFFTQEKCEELCAVLPPPSCSADSGIVDKSSSKNNFAKTK